MREAPVLDKLIDMIIEEHEIQSRKQQPGPYRISHALKFLAENVEKHYPELWRTHTNKRAFIPARWPILVSNQNANDNKNNIVLMPVDKIFKSLSPSKEKTTGFETMTELMESTSYYDFVKSRKVLSKFQRVSESAVLSCSFFLY